MNYLLKYIGNFILSLKALILINSTLFTDIFKGVV